LPHPDAGHRTPDTEGSADDGCDVVIAMTRSTLLPLALTPIVNVMTSPSPTR
jgi:hypothetical protein